MFKLLVDTCVWLDLAKDAKQDATIAAVEELLRRGDMEIVVPRIVLDEFKRNRGRVERDLSKSLSAHFRIVREAVTKAGGSKQKVDSVLAYLDDAGHKVPLVGGQAVLRLNRIEKLLAASRTIEASQLATLNAAQRAIDKRAPFHRNTNAMADAVLIEIYGELARDKRESGVRFAFVTHNKSDFSAEGANQKQPHTDLASMFSKIKSLYFINLPEALRRIDSSLVTQAMLEDSWNQDPRSLSSILEAEQKLFNQVWYNRHWNTRIKIQRGETKVVDHPADAKKSEKTIEQRVWKGALKAARDVEQRYGKKELGGLDPLP